MQLCCSLSILWHCLSLWLEFNFFQSCGHCWVFQICWHIECSTFTASTFRIWNSATGIPSPPLALFIVMLPKVHLTSHSRLSGSRWVTTPMWLSGSWRSLFYSSSVYSCHLLLISSASVRSIQFLSFIQPIFAWTLPFVSLIFLKRSLVFPILLFSSISLHWSLRKAFLSLTAIRWNSAFKWVDFSFSPLLFTSLLFTIICKASSNSPFALLHPAAAAWHRGRGSYAMSKVRSGGQGELRHVQGQEHWLGFAGTAVKRYLTSKVRETQVRG